MAFCKNCGTELDENAKFCPNCGSKVEATTDNSTTEETNESKSEAVNAEVVSTDKNQDNLIFGILAYLGILVLIPIIAKKDDKFVKYHCNQGLILLILEVAITIIQGIFSFIPVLGVIINIAAGICDLGILILVVLGIINVVNGKTDEFPYVGKFFSKFTILK